MLPIERDFLYSIQTNNHSFTEYCLRVGLTANVRDEKGVCALEYALYYKNDKALAKLATHPKTTKETLALALDLLEVLRLSDKDLQAVQEYEKKTSFLNKVMDVLFSNKGIVLYSNAAGSARRYYFIQKLLYEKYQNQHN